MVFLALNSSCQTKTPPTTTPPPTKQSPQHPQFGNHCSTRLCFLAASCRPSCCSVSCYIFSQLERWKPANGFKWNKPNLCWFWSAIMTKNISICQVPQYWEKDKKKTKLINVFRIRGLQTEGLLSLYRVNKNLVTTMWPLWLYDWGCCPFGPMAVTLGSGRASLNTDTILPTSSQGLWLLFRFQSAYVGPNSFFNVCGVIQFHSHPCDTSHLPRLAGACNAAVTLSLVSGQLFTPPEGTLQEPHASSPSKSTTPGIMDAFLMHRSPDCPGVPHPQTLTMSRSGGTVYYLVSSLFFKLKCHVFASLCSCKIHVFCRLIGLMCTFSCVAVFFFFLRHNLDSTELCFCTFNDSVSVTLQRWAARPCSPDRLRDPAMSLFPAPRWPGMKLCIHVAVREPIFSVCRSPISTQ